MPNPPVTPRKVPENLRHLVTGENPAAPIPHAVAPPPQATPAYPQPDGMPSFSGPIAPPVAVSPGLGAELVYGQPMRSDQLAPSFSDWTQAEDRAPISSELTMQSIADAPLTPEQIKGNCRAYAHAMEQQIASSDPRSPLSGHPEPRYLYGQTVITLRQAAATIEILSDQLAAAWEEAKRARAGAEVKPEAEKEKCQTGTTTPPNSPPSASSPPPKTSG